MVRLRNFATAWQDESIFVSRALAFIYIFSAMAPFATGYTNSLGINYGMMANNLPSPTQVVRLIQSIPITKSKIYNTDSVVLTAFGNTGISFIVGIGNEDVPGLLDPSNATNWVGRHIGLYLPNTQIVGIAVGNEVFSGNDTNLMSQLLPAMQNVQSALINLGLEGKIAISTPHSFNILSSSYPPSSGAFRSDLVSSYLKPLLEFLSQTGSPFMINAYPYFAYKFNPSTVSLAYALFEPNPGVTDMNTGLRYYNMFDAQIDAVYSALQAIGYQNLQVMVSETGWPSAGDPDEPGATIQNAQLYNTNLIQHLASNRGTPLKPNQHVEAYIFALFNEDNKPGPASERNYGLFHPDGTMVYDFGLDNLYSSSSLYYTSSSLEVGPLLAMCFLCLAFSLFCSFMVS